MEVLNLPKSTEAGTNLGLYQIRDTLMHINEPGQNFELHIAVPEAGFFFLLHFRNGYHPT